MKSAKVYNVLSTQQRNPDGSYALAEALTYVPGVHLDKDSAPPILCRTTDWRKFDRLYTLNKERTHSK